LLSSSIFITFNNNRKCGKMDEINKITLIVLSLSGAAIIFYVFLKRLRKERSDPPYNPKKDDPLIHIRNKLFLEIPIEKILIGYFVAVTLVYAFKLIIGKSFIGLDLTIFYLSGIIFLLVLYKMGMAIGVVNRFSPWLLFSLVFSALIFWQVKNSFGADLSLMLADTRQYHLTVHLLGLVLGLGGTLIVDIMFTHFLRKYDITAGDSVILHLIGQMIILGLILLLLSGLALFIPGQDLYLDSSRFLMKMTVVFFVIMNGIALNFYVTPKMKKISLKEEEQGRYETFKKISFALGGISILSWLSAFLLAMLKDVFNLHYLWLLAGYLVLLMLVIFASQFAKAYYEGKEAQENT
jgi:hypothetical protein